MIPFLQQFTGDRDDKELLAKLLAESPGILAWAVRGCLEWQKVGLGLPTSVSEATREYREECDPLADFIEDRCVIENGAQVASRELWDAYQYWNSYESGRALDRTTFTHRLEARGLTPGRRGHDRTRIWNGIRLRSDSRAADARTDADMDSAIAAGNGRKAEKQ